MNRAQEPRLRGGGSVAGVLHTPAGVVGECAGVFSQACLVKLTHRGGEEGGRGFWWWWVVVIYLLAVCGWCLSDLLVVWVWVWGHGAEAPTTNAGWCIRVVIICLDGDGVGWQPCWIADYEEVS